MGNNIVEVEVLAMMRNLEKHEHKISNPNSHRLIERNLASSSGRHEDSQERNAFLWKLND
jgi:hypothetical protein